MNENLFSFFTPKSETYCLHEDVTIRQALEKFDYHKFSVVPLIDNEGKYITTVSTGDILRYVKNDANFDIHKAESVLVRDIDKYRPYRAVSWEVPVEEIYQLALEQNFVPLVDDRGIYIGIIKRKSILNNIYQQLEEANKKD